ncbi:molybdopterin biosynthesis protein [Alkaliphilus peptidifermentans]|uniref:Molybdopterin molybdenumtransferase n=1 Tax=Alkaliphilus peptidifermentans DSM 18978 TaxID=1120976 RepID=A0A1G5CMV8_9FIRM|nr:molybdopterin biosynthesis protein [Alkaliphilus peptidifermentans]SCY03726.1 molybdopterin molybdochelatase [Alkaliphilus peptidifermentans DSM 18978]
MKEKRNIYLTNIPLKEAQETYFSRVDILNLNSETEVVPVRESLDKVSVSPIFARKSSPNYNAAAMDGVAVVAAETYGATEINPLRLKRNSGFEFINTGGHIKEPYDAVIMIEDIVEIDKDWIEIYESANLWQHIRPIGEDIVEGELIISANHQIRPVDIGALLAGQIKEVEVYKLPRVGIIPTGSEIIDVSEEMTAGKIIESNASMFAAMIKQYQAIPKRYPVVVDEYNLIKEQVLKAVEENQLVVVNAGSSAGSKDYTVDVLREIGEVVIHGVATKPGKPVILAIVKGKPVVGIPGYPVSAYFTFEFFVKPLVAKLNHRPLQQPTTLRAYLSRRVVSSLKYEEYIRIKLGLVNDKMIATPLERGAGVTMSLVRADGVLVIPQQSEGYEGGTEVEVQLLKSTNEIQNTIVSIGSHDLVMDLLSDQLHYNHNNIYLSSAHVGSLGGIMAMKKGECHIAPVHLLDTVSGNYNEAYVKRYLNDQQIALIKFVGRSQGLMLKGGNPKGIKGIKDLQRPEVTFVNRQRGAGTRVLLDYHLSKEEIESSQIQGYEREMTTHMAVAAAIAGGTADCGLGIYSAAKAMGLDFIPIAWEDYDLLVTQEALKDVKILSLLETLKNTEYIKKIEALGGYKTDRIGEIIIL